MIRATKLAFLINFSYNKSSVLLERRLSMDNNIVAPVYAQIALDIASRIAKGDLKENSKVYGRSIMSSEYGVSPETIRRAIKLLEDMEIVETKQNSGTIILSAENAKIYVAKFNEQNNARSMQKQLADYIVQQEGINRKIIDIVGSIVRINEKFSETNPFNNYEVVIPNNSGIIGHTLGELKFWQETRATVIAIRRGNKIILSPGPYVLFEAEDTIIFVGDISSIKAVTDFINK
ncbi:TrkA C-terminal domain-containing protein [Butyricicoccus sp. Marseille-Q5471]|uniref:TrkA C-terminal domain-containing protein n=1 Tax=Butyricicoccus sp. Marseille-Q5471 TaxID=3039493 RepID=UPI0024BC0A3C|nr:TrkA C-terminal domain-containing protein [Butyricicoccus sp. Marseille-Q5471]